jgi:hypothetical protein
VTNLCVNCRGPFAGRSDKRFCTNGCRSAAWHVANFQPKYGVKYSGRGPIKHGAAQAGNKTSEYRIWCAMRERCNSPSHIEYHRYGARGIAVCSRWEDFSNFLEDMGPRPSPKHSIDRKNGSLGYEPSNCRWATLSEQQRNKSTSVLLTVNGETHHALEWAEKLNLSIHTIKLRLRKGKSHAEALMPPIKGRPR